MAGVAIATRLIDEEELLRRLLCGYTLKECAALQGCSYTTVCARARRPAFLEKLRELNGKTYEGVDMELRTLRGSLTQRVVEISSRAMDRLEELMDDATTDERLVVKIAQDFLDRNPEVSKSTKAVVKNEHVFMNPLVLQAAAAAAQEMDESTVPKLIEGE